MPNNRPGVISREPTYLGDSVYIRPDEEMGEGYYILYTYYNGAEHVIYLTPTSLTNLNRCLYPTHTDKP